jgi:hypothetical protein
LLATIAASIREKVSKPAVESNQGCRGGGCNTGLLLITSSLLKLHCRHNCCKH